MLELYHPAISGLHVCDVSYTVFGALDDLLPISGKLVFPSAVPLGFILPPWIAKETSFVSPVPNADLSAPCNHGSSAARTLARKIGLSLMALSVYVSKFHVWLKVQRASNDNAGLKHALGHVRLLRRVTH